MIKTNRATSLANRTILITRPRGREKHLRQLIENAGGSVIHYPAIEIEAPSKPEIEQLLHLRDQLHNFDMAIFISQTAVEQSQNYFPVLPDNMIIISVGSKTTSALEKLKLHVDIEATKHDTESLLQADELQKPGIKGARILIFRGSNGRALLGETLAQRGAQICYVETYRRTIPLLPALTKQQIATIDALTISSNEGLDNFIHIMGGADLLIEIPLLVPSQRARKLARSYGFKTVISAMNATDEATLAALIDYFSSLP